MDQKKILLGSDEPVETTINIDHINELNRIANTIKFGRIISITNQSRFDDHVDFDSGISIDFFLPLAVYYINDQMNYKYKKMETRNNNE